MKFLHSKLGGATLDDEFGHGPRWRSGEITWIELFMDLVFVAAVIQLGHQLIEDLTLRGVGEFCIVFSLLWWAWNGATLHLARRARDDTAARLLIFLFVFAIANMAIAIGRGVFEYSAPFALLFGVARLATALLYLELPRRRPEARQPALAYAVGYGMGALLWLASAAVPEPWRFLLWVAAVLLDLVTARTRDPEVLQKVLPVDIGRLSERYGQLTLIVIGEAFIKTVGGLVGHGGLSQQGLVYSAIAFTFICCFFWSYFGDVAGTTLARGWARFWAYGHLPLIGAIAATSAALEPMVALSTEEAEGWQPVARGVLHAGGASVFLCLAMIDRLARPKDARGGRRAAVSRLASALLLLAAWPLGTLLPPMGAALLAAAAIALPVLVEALRRPHANAPSRAEIDDAPETERGPDEPESQLPVGGEPTVEGGTNETVE